MDESRKIGGCKTPGTATSQWTADSLLEAGYRQQLADSHIEKIKIVTKRCSFEPITSHGTKAEYVNNIYSNSCVMIINHRCYDSHYKKIMSYLIS